VRASVGSAWLEFKRISGELRALYEAVLRDGRIAAGRTVGMSFTSQY